MPSKSSKAFDSASSCGPSRAISVLFSFRDSADVFAGGAEQGFSRDLCFKAYVDTGK